MPQQTTEIVLSSDRRFKKRSVRSIVLYFTRREPEKRKLKYPPAPGRRLRGGIWVSTTAAAITSRLKTVPACKFDNDFKIILNEYWNLSCLCTEALKYLGNLSSACHKLWRYKKPISGCGGGALHFRDPAPITPLDFQPSRHQRNPWKAKNTSDKLTIQSSRTILLC